LNPILTENLEAITELCRKYQVIQLDAFGSVLTSEFGPESDVDFVVKFYRDSETNAFHQYFELKEALEHLLKRPVDLVCGEGLRNSAFRSVLEESRSPLFAA